MGLTTYIHVCSFSRSPTVHTMILCRYAQAMVTREWGCTKTFLRCELEMCASARDVLFEVRDSEADYRRREPVGTPWTLTYSADAI